MGPNRSWCGERHHGVPEQGDKGVRRKVVQCNVSDSKWGEEGIPGGVIWHVGSKPEWDEEGIYGGVGGGSGPAVAVKPKQVEEDTPGEVSWHRVRGHTE